jgi:hypothetical protein
MRIFLRLEEVGILILSFYLSILLGYSWWVFILFIFAPDISMVGYLLGTKAGSIIYNIVHFKLLAIIIGLVGYLLSVPAVALVGHILLGHSSLDRILGYGLKYPDDFKHTHLGWIGSNDSNVNLLKNGKLK